MSKLPSSILRTMMNQLITSETANGAYFQQGGLFELFSLTNSQLEDSRIYRHETDQKHENPRFEIIVRILYERNRSCSVNISFKSKLLSKTNTSVSNLRSTIASTPTNEGSSGYFVESKIRSDSRITFIRSQCHRP